MFYCLRGFTVIWDFEFEKGNINFILCFVEVQTSETSFWISNKMYKLRMYFDALMLRSFLGQNWCKQVIQVDYEINMFRSTSKSVTTKKLSNTCVLDHRGWLCLFMLISFVKNLFNFSLFSMHCELPRGCEKFSKLNERYTKWKFWITEGVIATFFT